MAIYLEEFGNMRPGKYGNFKDLEQFADILDITINNLKEKGNCRELENGSLYPGLQKTWPEIMLTQYQRWIFEKRRQASEETLRESIIMESEYRTVAHEAVYGFQETNKQSGRMTYHADTAWACCKICGRKDRVWQCYISKNMSKQKR